MPIPDRPATDTAIATMLADGLEEVEVLAVADALYRTGVYSDLISVIGARHVTGSHNIRVIADLMFGDVDLSTYTVLFLPGGMPGTLNLKDTPTIQAEVLRRSDAAQPIAAICAAPSILSELGVLDGHHATMNPAFVKAIIEDDAIVHRNPAIIGEQIITSRGADTSLELGLEIIHLLLGDNVINEVVRGVMLTRWRVLLRTPKGPSLRTSPRKPRP